MLKELMQNMKKIVVFILTIIMTFLIVSCNKKNSSNDSHINSEETYVFVDDLNREIKVNKPKRVATLLGSFADMWMLAGGQICASSDDAWEDFNLDLPKDTVNLGSAHRPNKELILSSNPDFVIASPKLSRQRELLDTFESARINVAYFDVGNFNSFMKVLKIMTDITNEKDNYKIYGEEQKIKIDNIISRNKDKEKQTVLVMRASATSIRAKNSDGTMLGGMLKDFGCINIADSDSMLLENLNIESIIEANPNKIFFVETGDDIDGIKKNVERMFNENPLWKQLDAVKNNKVYYMDKHLYNLKPNAKFFLAYENLEKILYEDKA